MGSDVASSKKGGVQAGSQRLRRGGMGLLLGAALTLAAAPALAKDDPDAAPSAGAMTADLLVARPIGVVMTLGGLAAWTLSLPFSLPGGNAGEAAEQLVIGPVRDTFARCLGCTRVEETRGR